MRHKILISALLASLILAISACQLPPPPPAAPADVARETAPTPESATAPSLDDELYQIIADLELSGDPSAGRDLPDIEEPLAQLGMQLFFTKALAGDFDTACVSCHHPLLAGGDGLPVSIGVDAVEPDLLGPGRKHSSGLFTVPRNAPTTFNIALWDEVLFLDGRVESLGKTPGANGADGEGIRTPATDIGEADHLAGANLVVAQSRFPTTSQAEMRGAFEEGEGAQSLRLRLVGRLRGAGLTEGRSTETTWLELFQQTFETDAPANEVIVEQNVAAALGEYQRTQVFVDTPWKAYVQGDADAISEAAKRGALLFFKPTEQGGANCAACHSGDFFTDEDFHVLAVPQVGPGKEDREEEDDEEKDPFVRDDRGRYLETRDPDDLYAFRTPTLLNVEVTGPYGHDGAFSTLEGMIRHNLDPFQSFETYDTGQLSPGTQIIRMRENTQKALDKLAADMEAGKSDLEIVELSDAQVQDLVEFMLTLTDPCVKDPACLAPWIPDESDPDPDGMRLRAVFADSESN